MRNWCKPANLVSRDLKAPGFRKKWTDPTCQFNELVSVWHLSIYKSSVIPVKYACFGISSVMSASPNTGRSDDQIRVDLSGCFRPEAVTQAGNFLATLPSNSSNTTLFTKRRTADLAWFRTLQALSRIHR